MSDFDIVLAAGIEDSYLRDIGFDPSNKSGICPIHGANHKNDKNFSHTEKNGKRVFSCWTKGCVMGSDVIELCRVKEGFDTSVQAMLFLAEKYNIPISNKYLKKELTEEEKRELKEKQKKEYEKKRTLWKLGIAYKNAMDIKNLDLALRLSFLQDKVKEDGEYEDSDIEKINYSNYYANDIYEVNQYISETPTGAMDAIERALRGQTVGFFSPTGSGKTHTFADICKDDNIKVLVILPLQSNVEQFVKDFPWFWGAWGKKSINKIMKKKATKVVMTWNKAAQLAKNKDIDLNEYIIIADEIHQTFVDTFRGEAISGFYRLCSRVKGRVDVTATPNKLDFSTYNHIVKYVQTTQTKYNVKLYDNDSLSLSVSKAIEIANKSDKFAILMNDTKNLNFILENVNKKCTVINSDNKDHNKFYAKIIDESAIGDIEGILNTSVIIAGVNIEDKDMTDIMTIGITDISTIRQYVARFRHLESVNVHIFNNFNKEAKIYSVESLVNKNIEIAKQLAESYTTISLIHKAKSLENVVAEMILEDSIKAIGVGSLVYFNEDTQSYEVNEFSIRAKVYQEYYKSRTVEQFEILLREYFDSVEIDKLYEIDKIFDIEDEPTEEEIEAYEIYKKEFEERKEKELKEAAQVNSNLISYKKNMSDKKIEALEFLEEHKNILVGYDNIIKNDFSADLFEYMLNNKLSPTEVSKQYKELELQKIVSESKIVESISRYSGYVLDLGFSTELAWKVAHWGTLKRKNFFKKLHTIGFRELRFNYDNIVNESLIENQIFDFIVDNFKLGISYTQKHLDELSKEIQDNFGENHEFAPNKIGIYINNIYLTTKNKHRDLSNTEYLYYKNIIPSMPVNKNGKESRIQINTIQSFLEVKDIKKELALTSSDESLERYVFKYMNSHLAKKKLSINDAKFTEVDFDDIF